METYRDRVDEAIKSIITRARLTGGCNGMIEALDYDYEAVAFAIKCGMERNIDVGYTVTAPEIQCLGDYPDEMIISHRDAIEHMLSEVSGAGEYTVFNYVDGEKYATFALTTHGGMRISIGNIEKNIYRERNMSDVASAPPPSANYVGAPAHLS